jgi:hypothetical protein
MSEPAGRIFVDIHAIALASTQKSDCRFGPSVGLGETHKAVDDDVHRIDGVSLTDDKG